MIHSKIPNLVVSLKEAMISNGEIGTIKDSVDIIADYEAETMIRLSANQVRYMFEEAAESFVDSMQQNAWDSVNESMPYNPYTNEDAERDCDFYEAMRPSVIRRKELESL
jgi:hypothetical protein